MAWAYALPLIMQFLQSQGQGGQGMQAQGGGMGAGSSGVPFGRIEGSGQGEPVPFVNDGSNPYGPIESSGQGMPARNFFNPLNGPSYSSQQGMLGSGAPGAGMGGGAGGGGLGAGAGGGANWMSMLGSMGGGGGGGGMGALQGPGQKIGGASAGIANGLFNLLFAKNPSDSAMPYLNGMGDMMKGYMQPYIDAGMKALPTLQDQYGQLIKDPGSVMNRIGSGFQQSPGYQFQTQQALGAANRAAAAGGMAGTPQEQMQIAGTVNGLANQDYYNYLNHGIGMYGQGMSGLSNLYGTGFGASSQLMQGLEKMMMAQAANAYAGTNTWNQQVGGGIGSIAGGIGSLF